MNTMVGASEVVLPQESTIKPKLVFDVAESFSILTFQQIQESKQFVKKLVRTPKLLVSFCKYIRAIIAAASE